MSQSNTSEPGPIAGFIITVLTIVFAFAFLAGDDSETDKSSVKAASSTAIYMPDNYTNPIKYIGLPISEASKLAGVEANQAGNIIFEGTYGKMLISSSGTKNISYVDIEFLKHPCDTDKSFKSRPFIDAIGIDFKGIEFDYTKSRLHHHVYRDHVNKLKIFVACLSDGEPITVGFSSKYYLE